MRYFLKSNQSKSMVALSVDLTLKLGAQVMTLIALSCRLAYLSLNAVLKDVIEHSDMSAMVCMIKPLILTLEAAFEDIHDGV